MELRFVEKERRRIREQPDASVAFRIRWIVGACEVATLSVAMICCDLKRRQEIIPSKHWKILQNFFFTLPYF
jgi:hypothetical protein